MATRSNIAYRTPEGKIRSVYCHWDGYPTHNGEMLRRYYTTQEKVEALIALGSISSLSKEIGEKQDFNARYNGGTVNEDWCMVYHRDRGEDLEVRTFNDAMDFVDNFDWGAEYFYLWTGAEWLVNAYQRKSSNGFPEFDRVVDILDPSELKRMGWEGVDEDPAFRNEDAF